MTDQDQSVGDLIAPETIGREATREGKGSYDESWSIARLLIERVKASPTGVLFDRKNSVGSAWVPVTTRTFYDEVIRLASGLIASGIEPGDRVAIMSRTRYEWTLIDFACWFAAAVPVPIYETSSADQAEWILSNSGATMAFVESRSHADVLDEIKNTATDLKEVLIITKGAVAAVSNRGSDVKDSEVLSRTEAIKVTDLATIIYTSGTTGRPKGAELTHQNFVHLCIHGLADEGLVEVIGKPGARTLLFMPLAHVFARFVQVVCVAAGSTLGHAPDIKNLVPDLGSFKPTFLLGVPRVFEKVYNSADAKSASSPVKSRIFRWASQVATDYSEAIEADEVTKSMKMKLRAGDRLVFGKLREIMGGQLEYAVSGGGPLGKRLGHFYRGMGVKILEGYGLTETTAPTTVNRPGQTKIGSVGPPFPGSSARIGEGGEIEIKGDHVFRGYWQNEEATAEAFRDGWFRTGDLGQMDEDGYVTITGRRKEIIVTAGGKNVAPTIMEDRLRGHPIVSQVVVVGDNKPFIGALITLDADMLPQWLENHGEPNMSLAEAAKNATVLERLQKAVDRTNRSVSRAESIREWRVLETDFTERNGYLTPSTKVKRKEVLHDFADEVEAIYNGNQK